MVIRSSLTTPEFRFDICLLIIWRSYLVKWSESVYIYRTVVSSPAEQSSEHVYECDWCINTSISSLYQNTPTAYSTINKISGCLCLPDSFPMTCVWWGYQIGVLSQTFTRADINNINKRWSVARVLTLSQHTHEVLHVSSVCNNTHMKCCTCPHFVTTHTWSVARVLSLSQHTHK